MTMTVRSPAEERKRAIPLWRRVGPLVVVLVAVAAFVAACGDGSSSPGVASLGSATTTTTAGSNGSSQQSSARQSGLLYASCIRAHGFPNFPDPTVLNGVVIFDSSFKSEPQFHSAAQACRADLPTPRSTGAKHVNPQEELTFARCMRAHGITNFPDPMPGGGFNFPVELNPNSPQYVAAANACGEHLVSGPGGSSFSSEP